MNILEITVQRKVDDGWPVVVSDRRNDSLHMRVVGRLQVDERDLLQGVDPQGYGEALGKALFQDDVRDAFVSALSAADEHLRVALFVEADDLKALRWERICAPMNGCWDFLTLSQRTPFSLLTPSATDHFPPPVLDYDVRALVVVASPQGLGSYKLDSFDVGRAVAGVCSAFGVIPYEALASVDDKIEAAGPPTLDELVARLTDGDFTLLHVVCHGQYRKKDGESLLFLAKADGGVDPVSATRLIERLRLLGAGLPRMVFLSTCESAAPEAEGALGGLAQRMVRELGVSAVVAMTEKVSVETANALGAAFYPRLLSHGQPDLALAEAAASLAERADITTPALFCRAPEDNRIIEIPQGDARLVIETKPYEPETALIPAGPFLMGSEPGEGVPKCETPQHEVTLSLYRMGKYAVTNREYAVFITDTGQVAPPELGWEGNTPPAEKMDRPVAGVTWYEAVAYCDWLYDRTRRRYALPSEAQWEKAARGAYGCCDMVDNAREWTTTLWGSKSRTPDDQFRYPWVDDDGRDNLNANGQIRRVIRGGSRTGSGSPARASRRGSLMPDQRGLPGARIGFRLILRMEK